MTSTDSSDKRTQEASEAFLVGYLTACLRQVGSADAQPEVAGGASSPRSIIASVPVVPGRWRIVIEPYE